MQTNKTWQIPTHWNSRYDKTLQNILLLPLKLWHGKILIQDTIVLGMEKSRSVQDKQQKVT